MTLFSNGQADHWTMGASQSDAHLSMDALKMVWRLRFTYTYPTGDLRFGIPDQWNRAEGIGLSTRFRGKMALFEPTTDCRLSAGLWQEKVVLEIEHRYRTDDRSGLIVGVKIRTTSLFAAGIRRGLIHPEPAASELYYDFSDGSGGCDRVGGPVDWSIPIWLTQVDMAVTPAPGLCLRSTIRDADMTPTTPSVSGEASGNYRATLSGTVYSGTAEIEYLPGLRWRVWVNVRHARLNARLMGYDGGKLFAHFGVVHADVSHRLFGLQYRRYRFSAGFGSGEGALMGSVEVWPFAEGLMRLLGERRHIVAEGTLRWKEAMLRGPVVSCRWFDLEVAVDWLRVLPAATWRTWRPAVLGLGIDDLKSDRLDLLRADLVRLRLMPVVRMGEFALTLDVSQWVPVSVRENEESGASGSSGSGAPSKGNGRRKTWGGFSVSVRLSVGN
jgi:hypothetical protein